MAVQQFNRHDLSALFSDGKAPIGEDFASIFLSTLNKTDDGVQLNGSGNIELTKGGIRLNATGTGESGTLRFVGSTLQYHDGSGYQTISTGSGGAFIPIGASANVAFLEGNVGIGPFDATSIPNRLDVILGPNVDVNNRVKLGNLLIHNGAGTSANPNGAYICNAALVANPQQFALFQDSAGNTTINAKGSNQLLISQENVGRIIINQLGGIQLIPNSGQTVTIGAGFGNTRDAIINGNLTVSGTINGTVIPPSDLRIKKDIQPFNEGFEKILSLNPVKFKYNGKAGTPDDGRNYVGFVAQDLQKVYPELIISQSKRLNSDDLEETEVLSYDPAPLISVIINAIKEIGLRLDNLEKSLTHAKRKPANKTRANS